MFGCVGGSDCRVDLVGVGRPVPDCDANGGMPRLPASGGFVQAGEAAGRPGGAGATAAIALACAAAVDALLSLAGGPMAG